MKFTHLNPPVTPTTKIPTTVDRDNQQPTHTHGNNKQYRTTVDTYSQQPMPTADIRLSATININNELPTISMHIYLQKYIQIWSYSNVSVSVCLFVCFLHLISVLDAVPNKFRMQVRLEPAPKNLPSLNFLKTIMKLNRLKTWTRARQCQFNLSTCNQLPTKSIENFLVELCRIVADSACCFCFAVRFVKWWRALLSPSLKGLSHEMDLAFDDMYG